MRHPIFILLVLFAVITSFTANYGCANIVPPSGGPRDSIPPVLLKSDPADSSVNFRSKEINLSFDEYVEIKDPANNIIFTPLFANRPEVSSQGRTIRIRFKDTLEPNTTYVMNFGNAIVDINESNPLPDFNYIFSTGPVLDSLELRGRVILAETGGIDSTLSVILHRNLDTAAVKTSQPQYVVKLNQQGAFRFRYLPSDTFAIYAIGSGGAGRSYTMLTQLFAFADSPVLAGQADSIVLYAYREKVPLTQGATGGLGSIPGRMTANDRRLRFTTPQGALDLQTDYVISFPVPLRNFDSSKVELTSDSIFTPVNFSARLDSLGKQLIVRTDWKENTSYNLVLQKDFANDSTGRQLLKTDRLYFTTKKLADYGQVSIRLKDADLAGNPVLQFVQNNQVVFSSPIKSGSFINTRFNPGEYNLRILYDRNDNGKWDPGSFSEKRQPEIVVPIQRTITIKPAWDNEFDIAL